MNKFYGCSYARTTMNVNKIYSKHQVRQTTNENYTETNLFFTVQRLLQYSHWINTLELPYSPAMVVLQPTMVQQCVIDHFQQMIFRFLITKVWNCGKKCLFLSIEITLKHGRLEPVVISPPLPNFHKKCENRSTQAKL